MKTRIGSGVAFLALLLCMGGCQNSSHKNPEVQSARLPKKSDQKNHTESITVSHSYTEQVAPSTVFFAFDSTDLEPEAKHDLEKIIAIANQMESKELFVGGHTDEIGSEEYNYHLSAKRAEVVASYLKDNGYTGEVNIIAYGKTKPCKLGLSNRKTDIQKAAVNRRANIGTKNTTMPVINA